jgi:hypothetical protein
MTRKRYEPGEIGAKLQQVDMMASQGQVGSDEQFRYLAGSPQSSHSAASPAAGRRSPKCDAAHKCVIFC